MIQKSASIKNIHRSSYPSKTPLLKQKIKPQDIIIFSKQMAIMLSAGIPLIQSLKIIHSSFDSSLQFVLQAMIIDIEKGNSIYNALKNHPKAFDPFYCSLVAIGELSGTLDISLIHLTTYKEKNEKLIQKIKMAMIYPLIVLTIALFTIILLLIYVIPTFKLMFQEFKSELPSFTKILLGCSDGLYYYGWFILLVMVIFIKIGLVFYRKHASIQYYCHQLILKCPILGNLMQQNILARFSWSLTTALSAGVPLTEALNAVSHIVTNRIYEKAIQHLKLNIITGNSLNDSMKKAKLFPPLMIQMIHVGEESGKIEELLKKMAMLYEEAFDSKLSSFVALLEPLMMVVLGFIIAALVIGIYLPIFKIGSLF